jgi:uncharacterized protein
MRQDIIEYLQMEIKRRCEQPNNFFGMGCYYHIRAVVNNASMLAKQFGADKEVAIIAAWLHDVASITDYNLYEEHHIHGAEMAREILEKFNYDKKKTVQVQSCILNHRGSISGERLSLEEICVADADAISHFDSVPSLLYLAYVERKLNIEEGIIFVKEKLERSYNKLSDRSKEIYKEKYQQVMDILV